MTSFIYFAILFGFLCEICSTSGCNYPSDLQNAVWYDNERYMLNFTANDLSGFVIQSYTSTVTDWSCHIIHNDYVISKGKTTIYLFGSPQDVYICMKMTKITDSSFYYYLMSDEEVNANNERVYIVQTGTVVSDVNVLCYTSSPASSEEYNVIVKQGYEDLAKQWCPTAFLGIFYYTYNNGSGNSCGAGSEWDVCSNRTTMMFNYTQCATTVSFTELDVFCVLSITSGSTTYLTVFNNGNVDTINYYRYTCMAFSSTGSSLSVSLQKGKCDKGQSPTVSPTGGATATLTAYYTCPFISTSETASEQNAIASIIGAVTGAVIIIILLAIILFFLLMKYKEKKKIQPELPAGPKAYFVREFTFERLQNKLRAEHGDNLPTSDCTSVSTIDEDYIVSKKM